MAIPLFGLNHYCTDYVFLDSLEEVSGDEATASHSPKTSNLVMPRDTLLTLHSY